jgi:hypothetical protein
MTKEIQLTKGKIAIVDDEDFVRVNQYKWQYVEGRIPGIGYAVRSTYSHRDARRKPLYLHRFIMGNPPGRLVRFIDGNPLNCRRRNLRECTRAEAAISASRAGSQAPLRNTRASRGLHARVNGAPPFTSMRVRSISGSLTKKSKRREHTRKRRTNTSPSSLTSCPPRSSSRLTDTPVRQ